MRRLDSIPDSMDKTLRNLQEIIDERGAWRAAVHEVSKSQHDQTTEAEAETPILWPPDVKDGLIGKYPDAGKN